MIIPKETKRMELTTNEWTMDIQVNVYQQSLQRMVVVELFERIWQFCGKIGRIMC